MRTEDRKENFRKSQQLWEQFVKADCDYTHSNLPKNVGRHRCAMQHYRLRLEELKKRNDLLEEDIDRMNRHHSQKQTES